MTGLFEKSAQWEVLAAPGNVIVREQDKGDLWELYRGLDGGSYIAMTNQQPVPRPGQAQFARLLRLSARPYKSAAGPFHFPIR